MQNFMFRSLAGFQILLLCLVALACGGNEPPASRTNSNVNARTPPPERVCEPTSDTPTEAYKRLYAAVKAKNTENIKAEMSEASREFAESLASRQNKPVEKVYENGFSATTFSPTLPEIRDERVKGCWGGLEVRNSKDNKWEDVPFVNEGGAWKFAIGEIFSNEYESPGKNRDTLEKEAANMARGNTAVPSYPMGNTNIGAPPPAPKYDGPQVEPLPKKR